MAKKVYVEVTVKRKPKPLIERMEFNPWPKKLVYRKRYFPFPALLSLSGIDFRKPEHRRSAQLLRGTIDRMAGITLSLNRTTGFRIRLGLSRSVRNPEGYALELTEKGCSIKARTAAGLFYGVTTLSQILAFSYHATLMLGAYRPAEPDAARMKYIPCLSIKDEPRYAVRSFMIDPGRATFPVPYIKRIIRIISSLKMNALHLHLLDDELCGLKFNRLRLGSENPHAMTLDELKDIIAYARSFHVSVIPEIESWGHVQSVLYHHPELYGGPGMWGGSSFGIGEKTYSLLGKIFDEIVPVLEKEAAVHVGLDEAIWTLLPEDKDRGHTPVKMVRRIHDIVQKIAAKHNKKITVHLWADHGGRPLPEEIRKKVVIEPWKYRQQDEAAIIDSLKKYGGKGKTPCMMGAGWSSIHFTGSYEATRHWTQHGDKYPNILGVTNCLWCSNDVAGQFLGLYGGADYSWNPFTAWERENDPVREDQRGFTAMRMRRWQALFPDAEPEALNADRGPEVSAGLYCWGPMAGKAAAPTADWEPRNDGRVRCDEKGFRIA
jgi:hypothetical protein